MSTTQIPKSACACVFDGPNSEIQVSLDVVSSPVGTSS